MVVNVKQGLAVGVISHAIKKDVLVLLLQGTPGSRGMLRGDVEHLRLDVREESG